MTEQTPARPQNVVVLDADNPFAEVRGAFFWLEEHEEIVANARAEAYQQGYDHGRDDIAVSRRPNIIGLRYRPTLLNRLRRLILLTCLVGGCAILLAAVILDVSGLR